MKKLNICLVSSELTPYAKTGGLADVTTALARFLHAKRHDVRVFVPLYASIDTAGRGFVAVDFLQGIHLHLGARTVVFSVYTAPLPDSGLMVYFIDCPALYDRPALYTNDPDEHLRFVLLCRATIECCQRMGWGPDVFHCNDWQSALLPLYLKVLYGWDKLFAHSRSVLGIHNIGYQGQFSAWFLGDIGLQDHAHYLYQDDLRHGIINFLKNGLLHADVLTTVSPTYAREIQTPEYGMGLESLLYARRDRLFGILNGVDYHEWNPATDPFLPFKYTPNDLDGKEKNKHALLDTLDLPYDPAVPVLGIVSRLATQKGFDLCYEPLPRLLRTRHFQLVVLGSGEYELENFFGWLHSQFPQQVAFHRGFSERLAHLIEAGSDLFLMPSRYEPCGLNQMYSLRYGTVPIVRKTGGLADTVQLYDRSSGTGTGVVFDHYDGPALAWAVQTALDLYAERPAWEQVQQNAMAQDYSWEKQGSHYLDLYDRLVRGAL